jgi:phage-related tail fiber protein
VGIKLKKGADFNGQRATNAADGSSATDLVTLQQLQAAQRGIDWKDSVKAASTANVTVASALINASTMDGVTLATGDRVLLKNQTTASENGIYLVAASGAASRAVDADVNAEVTAGLAVTVEQGTANGDKVFMLTTDGPIVLGTTSLTFSPLGGSGVSQAYQTIQANATPLTQRSTVNFGTGLTAADDAGNTRTNVTVDTSVVARKFAADCVVTTNPQTFTHGLGTDITVEVWEGLERVLPDVTKASTSGGQVTVDWGGAPTAAQYRVVVIG